MLTGLTLNPDEVNIWRILIAVILTAVLKVYFPPSSQFTVHRSELPSLLLLTAVSVEPSAD